MIDPSSLHAAGTIGKPFGYKGAVNIHSDFDIEPDSFIFLLMDGLPVPFRVTEVKPRGQDFVVRLRGIENDSEASALNKMTIYTDSIPEGEDDGIVYLSDLKGYILMDGDKTVGTICRVDDSTENVLLFVSTENGNETIIPAADDFMVEVDTENKILTMDLPEGLINLND